MITRQDRLKHQRNGGDGYNGPGLEAIAQENHRLSDGVFDQILNQQDTIMSYLMGQYEGELENA
jgi:hypothetical protein